MTAAATLLLGKILFLLVWLAALFVAERLRPAADRAPGTPADHRRRLGRNVGLWLINSGLSPLVVAPLTVAAAAGALAWRPAWWSGPPQPPPAGRARRPVPGRASGGPDHVDDAHRRPTRGQPPRRPRLLSAVARAAAILLLAFPLDSVLLFETLLLAAAIFHHSNLKLPPRLEAALSRVVITPSIHWVHHRPVRADTDTNYGTVLSVWDRLFTTRSQTRRRPDQPIGAEGQKELPFAALLLRPFRPQ